jgi:hypothetical protein
MPSISRNSFDANATDVENLIDIHSQIGGTDPGRRSASLQVLNRSGIVLVCAVWEAYSEDLAAEALRHLVENVASPTELPKRLRKQVATELKKDKNELSPWKLAGDDWKSYLKTRLAAFELERNRGLNTPTSRNIDQLFTDAIGLSEVSKSWYWAAMSADKARKKLDKYIVLRGDIAHRGVATVQRDLVEDFLKHVKYLVRKTDGRVNSFVKAETGASLF